MLDTAHMMRRSLDSVENVVFAIFEKTQSFALPSLSRQENERLLRVHRGWARNLVRSVAFSIPHECHMSCNLRS